MKKSWTTVPEEDKTQHQQKKSLKSKSKKKEKVKKKEEEVFVSIEQDNEETAEDIRSKKISMALAGAGVFLMLVGVSPFLFEGNGSNLSAFLIQNPSSDASIFMDDAEAETPETEANTTDVNTLEAAPLEEPEEVVTPAPTPVVTPTPVPTPAPTPTVVPIPNPTVVPNPVTVSAPTPTPISSPVVTPAPATNTVSNPAPLPTVTPAEVVVNSASNEPARVNKAVGQENLRNAAPENITTGTVDFPINTHTGGNGTPINFGSALQNNPKTDTLHGTAANMHSGAPRHAGAGLSVWPFIIFSFVLALYFRYRKRA